MTVHDEIVRFLTEEAHGSPPPGDVTLEETGDFWVSWSGSYGYKIFKPIKNDEVDRSTSALRDRACQREIRLNRRLAEGIYVGMRSLVRDETGLHFGDSPEPAEVALRLRRISADRQLTSCWKDHAPSEEIDRLADVLASFLLSAKEVSATSKAGKVETLEGQIRVWLGRLSDAAIDSDALRQLRAALLIFLATHESTFVQRRSHSRVRDGHGRLLAENVYLVDPLTIVGCVDTRDWSRQADILWDPAVLSVDLRRAGLVEAADRISAAVLERLGEPLGESPDENLWHFYSALAALAGAQDASDNAEWTDQDRSRAQAWLSAGQSHARRLGSQRLLITTGLMGTGKTTFTEALESHLGLERISSEDVARELYPAGGKGQPGHNRLDPAQSDRIYGELIRRMRDWLARGVSVVVDAGFLHARHRQWALEAARSVGVEPMFIECRLSKTETIARLDRRYKKNRTRPGSRPELYEEQARLFEPPDEIPSQSVQVLNMGQPVPKLVEIIREWLL